MTTPDPDLPPGVTWHYDDRFGHHWLRMDHCHIACVSRLELADGWLVHVNRHWGIERKLVGGRAATLAFGRKMVHRWLLANLPRIRAEVDALPKPHRLECIVEPRTAPPATPFDENNIQVPKRKARRSRR